MCVGPDDVSQQVKVQNFKRKTNCDELASQTDDDLR